MENSHVLGNFGKFQKPLSRAKIHFWKENLQPNFCHGKKIYCPEKSLGKNLIEKNQAESFSENFHNHVFAPKKKSCQNFENFPRSKYVHHKYSYTDFNDEENAQSEV